MIFCGDIALPFKDCIQIKIPDDIKKKIWFGNLEGSLIDGEEILKERKVFNDVSAIQTVCGNINFTVFNLANNHLDDVASAEKSIENLGNLNISHVGAGADILDAQQPICVIDDNLMQYVILAFGWEAINCNPARENDSGVNPYTKENVLSCTKNAINRFPNANVICYCHWNYELELYPQPLDRKLAHSLIDIGVYAVIGCHAHRVQGCEFYKGHPIVYGLGNFMFAQGEYMNGKLIFPEFSLLELAFEFGDNNSFIAHWFKYDKENRVVNYMYSENARESKILKDLTPFEDFSDKQYIKWVKENRYHKHKMLPFFYYHDLRILSKMKIKYIRFRHKVINIIKRLI